MRCKAVATRKGPKQCCRLVVAGDFCIMHQPDAVARRNVESAKRLVTYVRATLSRLGAAEDGARAELLEVLRANEKGAST